MLLELDVEDCNRNLGFSVFKPYRSIMKLGLHETINGLFYVSHKPFVNVIDIRYGKLIPKLCRILGSHSGDYE
jgi:hypothetical protein